MARERPKMDPADVRDKSHPSFRVSYRERQAVAEALTLSGLSISDFTRLAVFRETARRLKGEDGDRIADMCKLLNDAIKEIRKSEKRP